MKTYRYMSFSASPLRQDPKSSSSRSRKAGSEHGVCTCRSDHTMAAHFLAQRPDQRPDRERLASIRPLVASGGLLAWLSCPTDRLSCQESSSTPRSSSRQPRSRKADVLNVGQQKQTQIYVFIYIYIYLSIYIYIYILYFQIYIGMSTDA